MKTTKTKAWVSAIGMVATALTAALADNALNLSDAQALASALAVAAAGVAAVYRVKNRPVSGQGDGRGERTWQS